MKKKVLSFLSVVWAFAMAATVSSCGILNSMINSNSTSESSVVEEDGKKVLLVSIDGLRPDALVKTEFGKELQTMGCYSLQAQTINPSVTLPAHMSMFHSVPSYTHGVQNNQYTPSVDLGNGITETLTNAGKTCAMFYDWEKIGNVTKLETVSKTYINGNPEATGKEWFEDSTVELTDAVITHVNETPTDFTFLYYALTDEMGHTYNWMSDKYYWGINYVFENLERVFPLLWRWEN